MAGVRAAGERNTAGLETTHGQPAEDLHSVGKLAPAAVSETLRRGVVQDGAGTKNSTAGVGQKPQNTHPVVSIMEPVAYQQLH